MSGFLAATVTMLVLDAVWLGLVARTFYRQQLGPLMAERPSWPAAGIFYLLYAIGITVFVVSPSINDGSVGAGLWRGALFGLVAYATYDLTNQATLRGWPVLVTVVDLTWGTLLSATIGAVATYIVLRMA